MPRALHFGVIGRIDHLGIPAAQGKAPYVESQPFKREDLAPDECVADLGILIDEIGHPHSRRQIGALITAVIHPRTCPVC